MAALLALGTGDPATTSRDHKLVYVEGLRAVDAERWRDAVILFAAAIERQPASGGLVRPYGTWLEPYVPHYYLGLSLYQLGLYAEALASWKTAEAEGVIDYPRSRSKRRRMDRLREELPGRLAEQLASLSADLGSFDRSRARLAELPTLRRRGGQTDPLSERAESLAALLDRARQALERGEVESAAAVLGEAQQGLAAGWNETAELVDESRRGLAAIYQSAVEDRRARYERWATSLDRGDCQEAAIGPLDDLAREIYTEGGSDLLPATLSLLARAHRACSRGEAAALFEELAAQVAQPSVQDRGRGSRAQVHPSRLESASAAAADDFLTAAAWVEVGDCDPRPLALLRGLRAEPDATAVAAPEVWMPGIAFRPSFEEARAHLNCWDLPAAKESLERSLSSESPPPDLLRQLERWIDETPFTGLYSASYALVVSGSRYFAGTGWNNLPGAEEDALEVRRALESHGFQVELLRDPTSRELEDALKRFLARYGRQSQHRLLFYYAGHGWTEEAHGVKNGYIVPVDTPHPEIRGDEAFRHLVSMDRFEGLARGMLAQHALFVFDSCFGGTVFEAARARVESEVQDAPLRTLLSEEVRMFLTAGDESEEVPDFSVFRRWLLRGLDGEADDDRDGLVLGQELGRFVRTRVSSESRTTPLWGRMRVGSLGYGDIAFFRGQLSGVPAGQGAAPDRGTEQAALRLDLDLWGRVRENPSLPRVAAYLEIRPEGRFAGLARELIERGGAQ